MRKTSERILATNCMVLVAHRIDNSFLKYVSFLQQEADGIMDFIILYDCASSKIEPSDYPDFVFHLFNSRTLNGFFHNGAKKLPNPLIALLDMMKEKRYEHYLLMESDVVFTGSFKFFLETINEEDYDYIHVASDRLGHPEAHWPIEMIRDNPFKRLYFSWCQLFYVSRQFLMDLDTFIKENDSFYYEFLMPTMAYNRDYTIRQFENLGLNFQLSWGPAEVFEYKYLYERARNTFYHPIKDLNIVSYS